MTKLKNLYQEFIEDKNPFLINPSVYLGPILYFHPGKITIIGARPGMGKTLFMLYLFKLIFEKKGGNHLYISNEEDESILFRKLITTVSQEDLSKSREIINREPAKFPMLHNVNCNIHHHSGSWENLQKDIEEKIKTQKVDYLYIDKIQGLYSDKVFKTRSQELRYIILQLKTLSHKHQFSTIISSNLKKNIDKRDFRYPGIADLKDTGGLEDFSDLILLLFRKDYYDMFETEDGHIMQNVFQVMIAKNRYGSTDSYYLNFNNQASCLKVISPDGIDVQIA